MSSPLPEPSNLQSGGRERDVERMQKAADRYRRAMTSEKEREQLIEDYLPLVKSIVSRMRHHFPDTYEIEDMYGTGAKALVVSVNQWNVNASDSNNGSASAFLDIQEGTVILKPGSLFSPVDLPELKSFSWFSF